MAHLLLGSQSAVDSSSVQEKTSITAPIWISTPSDFLKYLEKLSKRERQTRCKNEERYSHEGNELLHSIRYLVLDEVDRFLLSPNRYIKYGDVGPIETLRPEHHQQHRAR